MREKGVLGGPSTKKLMEFWSFATSREKGCEDKVKEPVRGIKIIRIDNSNIIWYGRGGLGWVLEAGETRRYPSSLLLTSPTIFLFIQSP